MTDSADEAANLVDELVPTTNDVVQFPDGHLEAIVAVDVSSALDMVTTTSGFDFPVHLHLAIGNAPRVLHIDGERYPRGVDVVTRDIAARLAAARIPDDVEQDVARAENVLGYLGLNELRLMMVLDIIVDRWTAKMEKHLPAADANDVPDRQWIARLGSNVRHTVALLRELDYPLRADALSESARHVLQIAAARSAAPEAT